MLLSLVRAFITDPNVLCLHKPMAVLDDTTCKHVSTVLREYVDRRGLMQTGAVELRRPRTCVVTGGNRYLTKVSDAIFAVTKMSGITAVEMPSPGPSPRTRVQSPTETNGSS